MEKVKCLIFGRCSKNEQDYSRQIHDLTEIAERRNYDIVDVIATKITGRKTYNQRPDLKQLFSLVKSKAINKVLISEISRLGRSAKDIRNTIDFLHSNNVSIVFTHFGGMESLDDNGNETFVCNIIIAIKAEQAEEELRVLSNRVKSGLENARRKGKVIGRPKGSSFSNKELLKKYSKLVIDLKEGLSLNKCMKIHSVSKNTVIKLKKIINQ